MSTKGRRLEAER